MKEFQMFPARNIFPAQNVSRGLSMGDFSVFSSCNKDDSRIQKVFISNATPLIALLRSRSNKMPMYAPNKRQPKITIKHGQDRAFVEFKSNCRGMPVFI